VAFTIRRPARPALRRETGSGDPRAERGNPFPFFTLDSTEARLQEGLDLFQLPTRFRGRHDRGAPIRVPMDADSELLKAKQAEMQARSNACAICEAWFDLTEEERERIREDWSHAGACRSLRRCDPCRRNQGGSPFRSSEAGGLTIRVWLAQ